jgi:hypothetical protein
MMVQTRFELLVLASRIIECRAALAAEICFLWTIRAISGTL